MKSLLILFIALLLFVASHLSFATTKRNTIKFSTRCFYRRLGSGIIFEEFFKFFGAIWRSNAIVLSKD